MKDSRKLMEGFSGVLEGCERDFTCLNRPVLQDKRKRSSKQFF